MPRRRTLSMAFRPIIARDATAYHMRKRKPLNHSLTSLAFTQQPAPRIQVQYLFVPTWHQAPG